MRERRRRGAEDRRELGRNCVHGAHARWEAAQFRSSVRETLQTQGQGWARVLPCGRPPSSPWAPLAPCPEKKRLPPYRAAQCMLL